MASSGTAREVGVIQLIHKTKQKWNGIYVQMAEPHNGKMAFQLDHIPGVQRGAWNDTIRWSSDRGAWELRKKGKTMFRCTEDTDEPPNMAKWANVKGGRGIKFQVDFRRETREFHEKRQPQPKTETAPSAAGASKAAKARAKQALVPAGWATRYRHKKIPKFGECAGQPGRPEKGITVPFPKAARPVVFEWMRDPDTGRRTKTAVEEEEKRQEEYEKHREALQQQHEDRLGDRSAGVKPVKVDARTQMALLKKGGAGPNGVKRIAKESRFTDIRKFQKKETPLAACCNQLIDYLRGLQGGSGGGGGSHTAAKDDPTSAWKPIFGQECQAQYRADDLWYPAKVNEAFGKQWQIVYTEFNEPDVLPRSRLRPAPGWKPPAAKKGFKPGGQAADDDLLMMMGGGGKKKKGKKKKKNKAAKLKVDIDMINKFSRLGVDIPTTHDKIPGALESLLAKREELSAQ